MAFKGGRGPTLLGEESSRDTVSEECREAALAFMSGVAGGWDKLDLVMWLTGSYARAARHSQHGERVADLMGSAEVVEEELTEIVTRARAQLVASLERAVLEDGALDFAEDAVQRGLVRTAVDLDGEEVWIPVDSARMRLRDRVRSLFAADYLNRPESYAALYVCHRCENVVFDEGAKRLGSCNAHRRISGIVPRGTGDEAGRAVGDE